MVQPYLPQIAQGKRALVFLDGRFSHAVRRVRSWEPLLMELELIEPNLFLGWSPNGLSHFADAV